MTVASVANDEKLPNCTEDGNFQPERVPPLAATLQEKEQLPTEDGESVVTTNPQLLCCVCSKHVVEADTVVQCNNSQCDATAHAICAGYTLRGASRAKFLCATHKACKLLHGSKSKGKPHASTRKPTSNLGDESQLTHTPTPSSNAPGKPCLCSNASDGGSCSNCSPAVHSQDGTLSNGSPAVHSQDGTLSYVSLLEAHKSLSATFQHFESNCKKENKELRLYIIQLEERIYSLEKEISVLRSKHSSTIPAAKHSSSSASLSNRPTQHTINASRHGAGRRKVTVSYAEVLTDKGGEPPGTARASSKTVPPSYSHTRVFFNKASHGNGPPQVGSRIVRHSSGDSNHTQRSNPQTRPRPLSPFSSNFRIIWGTRFSTSESEVHEFLSSLVPSEDPQSIRVKKSVRKSSLRSKWWFTVLSTADILNTLDESWSLVEGNLAWKLQSSLRWPVASENGNPAAPTTSLHEAATSSQAGLVEEVTSPSIALQNHEETHILLSDSNCEQSPTTVFPLATEETSNPLPKSGVGNQTTYAPPTAMNGDKVDPVSSGVISASSSLPSSAKRMVSDTILNISDSECPSGHQNCA